MKRQRLILSVLLLGTMLPACADIILEAGGEGSIIRLSNYPTPMSGIVILSTGVPSASASPQVARNLQRAHAWGAYKSQNNATGGPLVFGGTGAVTDRQAAVRANVSRAHAFRLDYYK